jgi:hypothetical protein
MYYWLVVFFFNLLIQCSKYRVHTLGVGALARGGSDGARGPARRGQLLPHLPGHRRSPGPPPSYGGARHRKCTAEGTYGRWSGVKLTLDERCVVECVVSRPSGEQGAMSRPSTRPAAFSPALSLSRLGLIDKKASSTSPPRNRSPIFRSSCS